MYHSRVELYAITVQYGIDGSVVRLPLLSWDLPKGESAECESSVNRDKESLREAQHVFDEKGLYCY